MTLQQKEHKIKLLTLMLILQYELAKRNEFKSFAEMINSTCEAIFWVNELKKIKSIPTFESGCAIVGNSQTKEVVIDKHGKECRL